MLIGFVIILLIVGVGILISMYSMFIPFMQNIGDSVNYNIAYYGALSAIERGELAIKYRGPGFQGSGGFFGYTGFGPNSDMITGYFGRILSLNNGISREISSRTTTIPENGQGNVEYLLAAADSKNYNMIGYNTLESFFLGYDDADVSKYYASGDAIVSYQGSSIKGILRLPPKIFSGFGHNDQAYLDTQTDLDSNGITDDEIVTRSLLGVLNDVNMTPFKMIPTIVVDYSKSIVYNWLDNAIRKSLVNTYDTGYNIAFGMNGSYQFSPVNANSGLSGHTVISQRAATISNSGFTELFSSNTFVKNLRLTLGLVSILRSQNNNTYPFLEYFFDFGYPISDKFFTLQGRGRVGDYDVQIIIKKPSLDQSVAGDFTVIF